ncbi:glycosyltransferase family 39 protein [Patulibacter sp. SYSU D01012]|uniref:glycosyltransferase family 39 protein n=1 Tax=Patulibacter sp. SYSU D01012 TaxID=2817381 RepID=UPI001B30CF8B|nr:glycosyltransferase family 39 protein [Patulibacter sp. SYSU D01012]
MATHPPIERPLDARPDPPHTTAGPEPAAPSSRARRLALALRARPELVALLVLAAVLHLWALDRNGTANAYYAAAVRSMTQSWNAFLFGTFDGAGVMTVDKPPAALWVQALSARVFGFSSWSLLVPQALMGVATVGLTYDLTRRRFGRIAGGVAGLVLVLTPISVAISRHDNPDALLILCVVGALWATVRALEGGRTRWLVLAGVLVGLGFETKMAAALMVVPGLVAAYLWVAPRGRWAAARQTAAFGAAATVVGLAWPVLVWLTPAGSRPWISGTNDNSIWSLILGYNGLGRLFGQDGGPGGGARAGAAGGPGGGGGGMGGVFGGDPGPLRLLNDALGGQAGWLLGLALVAGAGLLVLTRLRRSDARTGWLVAVGGAWLVTAVAFSRAEGIFHPYYVSALAPFTAALVGAGIGTIARGGPTARTLGPLAIAGGVATELVVLHRSATDLGWMTPVLLVGGVVAAVALAVGRGGGRVRGAALGTIVALLLVAPGAWAVQTLGHATSSTFPAGGPASAGMGMGGPGGGRGGMRGGPGGMPGGAPPAGAMPGGAPGAAAGGTTGAAPGGGTSGTTGSPSGTAPTPGAAGRTTGTAGGRGGPGGGGMFGGDTQSLSAARRYAQAHGGGTVVVASQSGAATQILSSAGSAQVAGIGGFSGSESAVTADWLADAVASGKVRWFLAASGGGMGGRADGRVGATAISAIVERVGKQVASVDGLYDLQGLAAQLRAAG